MGAQKNKTISLNRSLPSCSMLKEDSEDQLMPNLESVKVVKSSLGSSCIVLKNKIVRFVQQGGVFVPSSNKEKTVPNSPKKSVRLPVNESIDYEAKSNYGLEDESRKRSLKGNNRKAKKHCDDISITDLFGDQRMESEPEETTLDLPNLPIQQNILNPVAILKLSVPLLTTGVLSVDIQKPLTKSPVERRKITTNQCVYTSEELDQLDLAGLSEPKTKEQLDEIMYLFHAAMHERGVVCCVCDQFLRTSESKLVPSASLLAAFFEKLQQPTSKNGDADVLHPQLLRQYDVSEFFPSERNRFIKFLLSPRGIEKHRLICTTDRVSECDCQPFLRICKKHCFDCLKRNALPKLAIANGNWFEQLPEQLRNMTLGTRSFVRPVHNYGHLVAYSSKNYVGGTSITSHIYSKQLNSPLVRISLPLQPSTVPVRVVVVLPFSKDAIIIQKAKIAAMKKNYIIDPKAIEQTLNFWKEVGNKVMAKVEFNKPNCERLPINDVFPAIFIMTDTDNEEVEKELNGSSHEDAEGKEHTSGGASLLRSNKEVEEIVITAATVTIGGDTPGESNVHGKVVDALSGNKVLSPSDTNSKIYVVRPDNSFVSDSSEVKQAK